MAHNRIEFHRILENVLGSKNVYFQPPATIQMSYPAIVYNLNDIRTRMANNKKYNLLKSYMVTLIHKNPDNDVVERLVELEHSKLVNTVTKDGLNHYVFEIYY